MVVRQRVSRALRTLEIADGGTLMDYFTSVEERFERRDAPGRAAQCATAPPGLAQPAPRCLPVALAAVTAGTALAATGVIPLGAPVHVRAA